MVTECGCTTDQFFQSLKNEGPNGENAIYVDIILAAAEYSNFIEMMNYYKSNHQPTEWLINKIKSYI